MCVKNLNDMTVRGTFDSNEASLFTIAFERCDPTKMGGPRCQSEEDIDSWMMGKYIVTAMNEIKFISHEFDEEEKI